MIVNEQMNTKEKEVAIKEQKEREETYAAICKVVSDSMYTCRELGKLFGAVARIIIRN